MNSNQKTRKAKAGLLLIASPRFKTLGEGLRRGTYAERKDADVKKILATMEFLDVVFPGIVYDKEEAVEAMDRFYMEKVDFVIAEFLSWSEDFAWIRFLRDMPEVPILFVNVAKDHVSFRDTLDEDDFIDYLCAGTLVGSLEASASSLRRPAPAPSSASRTWGCWPTTTRPCGPPTSTRTTCSPSWGPKSASCPIRPTAR